MLARVEQRTDEWRALRCGKVTASRVADVVARTKTGYGASRKNYMAELLAERLTGMAAEGYTNAAMQWGTDHEHEARLLYEFRTDATIEEVGFAVHPSIAESGASPDGLIGADGLIEIKCPNTATHLETLLGASVEKKYLLQMQWQMACTERKWCDFVSYDPRLPERYRMHVQRIVRDVPMLAELTSEIKAFLAELNDQERRLRAKFEPAA